MEKDIKDQVQKIDKIKHEQKINAWKIGEKAKIDNKANRKLCDSQYQEVKKKINHEAKSKMIDASVEKLRQRKIEKLKNKEAEIQTKAAQKKASIEANREKDKVAIEEKAENYRATNTVPTTTCATCKEVLTSIRLPKRKDST